MINQLELLKYLESDGKLTSEQMEQITRSSQSTGRTMEQVLVEGKYIDAEELTMIKAKLINFPYFNALDKKLDEIVLRIIPREVAENYKMVCFEHLGNVIKIGVVDPDDMKAVEAVEFLAREQAWQAEFFLISPQAFEKALKQYSTLGSEVSSALKTKEKEEEQDSLRTKKKEESMEEVIKSAPVAKIVSVIIRHAVDGRASDIHIEPMHKECRVRYRIDGVLHTSLILPKNIHPAIVARIKVMANLKLDETRVPQGGRFDMNINGHDIDFRVSTIPLMRDEKVVMRILDVTRGAPTLEELGFSHAILKVVKNNIKSTNGMFLVTGPTGSGKSTTLFAVLNMVNREGINISTLEDPVEYFVKGVNQSQVRPEVGFSFAGGLRSLLRQDPDIIMVGEIRDSETAELAIHASLTGHFVLTTLHTNNAIGAIPRLIDMGAEAFLLGSTLSAVVAQRLARKICEHCRTEADVPKDVAAMIMKEIEEVPENIKKEVFGLIDKKNIKFYKGAGCPRCGNSGYSGRIAVGEVIDVNDKVKQIIMDKNRVLTLNEVKSTQDYVSMTQDGYMKCIQGMTTVEEVLRVVRS